MLVCHLYYDEKNRLSRTGFTMYGFYDLLIIPLWLIFWPSCRIRDRYW